MKLGVAAACAVLQVVPLSMLYCQVASASKPLTVTPPLLVMLSVLLLPVSAVKAKVGAEGGVVSRDTVKLTSDALKLPAVSMNFLLATLTTALPLDTLLLKVTVAV